MSKKDELAMENYPNASLCRNAFRLGWNKCQNELQARIEKLEYALKVIENQSTDKLAIATAREALTKIRGEGSGRG